MNFEREHDQVSTPFFDLLSVSVQKAAQAFNFDAALIAKGPILDKYLDLALKSVDGKTKNWRSISIDISAEVIKLIWLDQFAQDPNAITTTATADLLVDATKGMGKVYYGIDPVGGAADFLWLKIKIFTMLLQLPVRG